MWRQCAVVQKRAAGQPELAWAVDLATMIQVSQAGSSEKPVETQARDQGYFFIPGLEPGKTYQLTVRTKDGEKLLVGRARLRR